MIKMYSNYKVTHFSDRGKP